MPSIHVLPKNVAELIAAGEVVERPASAIKEMIENAIDANCSKLTVEIQNGGIRYIRVTDNGCGITREDVPKAFISHATSKVATEQDLNAIYTFGFRGEALASIAAVAKVEMLTKTEDEAFGTRYVIEGGKQLVYDDAGCPDGTTLVVRELFYNTPARMKFLKKDSTEGSYVSDIVGKCAMANPSVSFRFIKDGKQVFFTPGDGNFLSAITAVLGNEFSKTLIPCDYELNGITVRGFVSLPTAGRATRSGQYFYVNSRYVKIPMGASALDAAYKNAVMVGKFPACVIDLVMPPAVVDVNVHPAKTEVRFSDEKRVFEAIYYAAKNAISLGDRRPQLHLKDAVKPAPLTGEQVVMDAAKKSPSVRSDSPSTFLSDRQTAAGVTAFSSENVIVYSPQSHDFMPAQSSTATEKQSDNRQPLPVLAESDPLSVDRDLSAGSQPAEKIETDRLPSDEASDPLPPAQKESMPSAPDFLYLGEAFQTYLIAQTGDKLLLIDKHALHERILFEQIKKKQVCVSPQALLLPLTVHLAQKEYAAICEQLEALHAIGFGIEDFGDGTLLVRECPLMFIDDSIPDVLSELADAILSNRKELITEHMDWLYHSAACRAAVKAGSHLEPDEAKRLIEQVLLNDSLRYCPHGRPVLIELTRRELEKQFGRIT